VAYFRTKVWDTGLTVNGFLAGLVAITAPCYWVSPLGSVIIGAIAGVVMIIGIEVIEWFRVDDPVGAVAVHGFCGIFGTLSIGLFATGDFGVPGATGADLSTGTVEGLFYGGGLDQLKAQLIGSVTVTAIVLVVGLALIVSTVIWVRTLTGWLVLPALGIAILALAWRGTAAQRRFGIQLLGVQACISVWQQFGYLFSSGGSVGGELHRSDTSAIADALLLPYWFWGAAISAVIVLLLWRSLAVAFRR